MSSLPSDNTTFSWPGAKAGLPRKGHDAHLKASPLEQLPHAEDLTPTSAISFSRETVSPFSSAAASAASTSARPQLQFLQARFLPATSGPQVDGSGITIPSSSNSSSSTRPSSARSPVCIFQVPVCEFSVGGIFTGAVAPTFQSGFCANANLS